MPVIYGGFELRPVQTVSYNRTSQPMGDGRSLGTAIQATIKGTIVPVKIDGVFAAVETDSRLSTVLQQQKLIREAFAEQGKVFEVQGWDGAAPTKFNARVISIDFSDGAWFDKSDYSIVVEGAEISGESTGNEYVDTASETWSFEEGDLPRSRKATHNVSAKGKTVYDATGLLPKKAWEYARDFCENRLGIGFDSTTPDAWSPLSGSDLAGTSASAPLSTNAWNRVVNETIDEADGTYSVNETWVLTEFNYVEEYTVTARRVDDQPAVTAVASIAGTIRGLYETQNDYDAKYANALARWTVVHGLLLSRAEEYVGTSLNTHPSVFSVDHNPVDGSISYQVEFNDRAITNGTYDVFSVSKRSSIEDYRTTVTVEGVLTGIAYLDEDMSPAIKLERAQAQWELIKGLMLSRAVAGSGITDLKAFPIQAQVSPNAVAGTISYSYEFDNRDPGHVRDEFTVESRYSREDGITTVTVAGTITGLRQGTVFGPADRDERYGYARSYFSGKSGQILSLAAMYVGTEKLNTSPIEQSESHNELAGTVSYQYSYNSRGMPCTTGALSEVITISDDIGTPQVAVIPIPGRESGPIFQSLGTQQESRRTVSAEIVMPRPGNVCTSIEAPEVNLDRYKPAGSQVALLQNQVVWTPTTGRLSKTYVWIFTS